MKKKEKHILGWREWVKLDGLDIKKIKVKVDTGARTSALHATDLVFKKRNNKEYVEFNVHPIQRSSKGERKCTARVLERRKVISSTGTASIRPVIETEITINNLTWSIELTLVNRDIMGFRMLLGRQAIKDKFIVDPGRSFIFNKLKKKRRDS